MEIIIYIIAIQAADTLLTVAYCIISKRYYKKVKPDTANGAVGRESQERLPIRIARAIYVFYGGWVRYKLIRLSHVPCHFYRKIKLKYVYQMVNAKKAIIYGGFEIRSPWNIEIGEGSVIGDEAKLDGRNGIHIGKNVNISSGVWIWTDQHDMNDPYFASNDKGGSVTIEDRVWLSSRTTVLPKVQIKEGAVIAAGSVVTKDCCEFSVYGGIPAKKIGARNSDLRYSFSGFHLPFY